MNMKCMIDKVAMRKKRRDRAALKFAAGIVTTVTIGIGVAAVLLYTTKSGEQLRKKVKNEAVDGAVHIKDVVQINTEKVKAFVADSADKAMDLGAASLAKAESVKDDIIDGGRSIIRNLSGNAEKTEDEDENDDEDE